MKLHDLTRKHGTKKIAGLMGITERSLIDKRRGRTALNVDDLDMLISHFPLFDAVGTIVDLARRRRHRYAVTQ